MHDPMTVAFDLKSPFSRDKYKPSLVTVWHVDPERDGSDDSCDWFGGRRLTEAQQATRDKIAQDFAFHWYQDAPYERFGWFMPAGAVVNGLFRDGEPNYSTHAIVLAMFRLAANNHFGPWSRKADRFLNRNLFNILFFAENSVDSLCDTIEQKHGPRNGNRDKQAKRLASVVYAWILRAERPWWKHPRWHFWHWKVQVHPLQTLRRWLFSRCCVCGKGFTRGEMVIGRGWDSPPDRWFEGFRGERDVMHQKCSHSSSPVDANGTMVKEGSV